MKKILTLMILLIGIITISGCDGNSEDILMTTDGSTNTYVFNVEELTLTITNADREDVYTILYCSMTFYDGTTYRYGFDNGSIYYTVMNTDGEYSINYNWI